MSYSYKSSILGGTFDHFHIGHEAFVSAPFNDSLNVTIGIVETPFSNAKSFSLTIESYEIRLQNLTNYLKDIGVHDRATIIPIHDIYGTTLTDKSIDAIYVTSSTKQNADLINEKRLTLNMSPLEMNVVPHVKTDDGQIVSSSLIRTGHIDRSGHSYLKIFKSNKVLVMPESLRDQLQKPLGPVITDLKNITTLTPPPTLFIAVGDVVSMDLIKAGIPLSICVVDFHTKRADIDESITTKYFPTIHQSLPNPRGTINRDIKGALLDSLDIYLNTKTSQIIKVDGEEDLLALPAILLAPLDSYVIYGLPDTGICLVKVTKDSKTLVEKYLSTFSSVL